ncbi:MAG TPA: MFS transporter [Acidimicrobiia bacterium]|nr:MFS transporter [Acidimicrobiia bacterium]
MTLPARLIQSVRPQASPGVMAGAAVVAATFAATPFLLPEISARLSIDIGLTGLLSTAQVGSFGLAAFFAGRLLRPRRRYHYGALGLVALATAGSVFAPNFPILLGTRVVAGLGMGTLTWIAWADATRFPRGMGDVAAVAPVTAAIASPLIAGIIQTGGFRWVFVSLSVLPLLATLLPVDFGVLPRIGRRVSGSRSNRMLLTALFILSVGGSSVFIFSGATAETVQGLSPVTISWALSLNAITGVIATRQQTRRGWAWFWILATATAALTIGTVASAALFFMAMALWGFAFWMAVPAVLRLLAERSLNPSERMGDAQASMAAGRVFGPLVGGFVLGAGSFAALSAVGALVMAVSAAVVGGVEAHRGREAGPPETETSG